VVHEAAAKSKSPKQVTHLPLLVISPGDINRLGRELDAIDDGLPEDTVRKDDDSAKAPKTSQLMDQLVDLNKLNLAHKGDRQLLGQFLAAVQKQAPVMHMSFSADPSPAFMEKLVTWLRREIHPQILVTIGLQPTIGAGCIVRTTNHQFDFSMRQDFVKKRALLIEKLTPEAKQSAAPPVEATA
jgi:hypothetical protein